MHQEISSKIVALTFGILAVVFLAAFYVVAWQEPSLAPPGGNVDTPINTGNVAQLKNSSIAATDFIDRTNPSYHLKPSGQSVIDTLCLGGECKNVWPIELFRVAAGTNPTCPSGYSVIMKHYPAKTCRPAPPCEGVASCTTSEGWMTAMSGVSIFWDGFHSVRHHPYPVCVFAWYFKNVWTDCNWGGQDNCFQVDWDKALCLKN